MNAPYEIVLLQNYGLYHNYSNTETKRGLGFGVPFFA